MRIFRYLISETLKSQLAVLFILMTIFVSQKFVRVLSDASEGDIPGAIIFQLLSLNLPALVSLILPLSLLSLVLALITASFTLWLVPWSLDQEQKLEDKARSESGLTALMPGRFQQASNRKAVIFVQSVGDNGDLEEVFVAQHNHSQGELQSGSVVMAKTGKVISETTGSQWLELGEGKRYAGDNDSYQMMSFDSYQLQIKEQQASEQLRKLEAYPTVELMSQTEPAAVAELQWRIAIPLAMPLLTLIAVPLSRVNPRQGKFGRMAPALLIYLGYFLLLMAAKSAIRDGVIPPVIGLWWIHFILLVFGLVLIGKGRPVGLRLLANLRFGAARGQ